MQNRIARVAGAALALALFSSMLPLPANAALLGGLAGTVGGIVGGTINTVGGAVGGATGGSVGGIAGGTLGGGGLSGPGGTLAGATGASPWTSGAGSLGGWPQHTDQGTPVMSNIPSVSPAMRASIIEALRQHVMGRLDAVVDGRVRLTLANGSTRTLGVAPAIALVLRAYLGKNVALRTLDGSTVTELVGRSDTVRGTVTSLDGGYVGFMSPTGLTDVVQFSPRDAASLRVGERIIASTSDFGRSMQLSTLGTAPISTLADVYVGRVVAVTHDTASLRIGARTQVFGIDPSLVGSLRGRIGKVVALDIPDGSNAKGLISGPTLDHLVGASPAGPLAGIVVGVTRDRLTLQLPNGDIRTLTGPVAMLKARLGATVGIAPLDRAHIRVKAGARVARLADVDACVTVNATCKQTISGRAIAVSPTALVVRLSDGDVRTYLGEIPRVGVSVGVPVRIALLDSTHVRVAALAHVGDLLDADACVTINSGCHAAVGSIRSIGNGRTIVTMPNGSQATVLGLLANVSIGSPILLQPLDSTHLVAMAGGSIGSVATLGACVTLNASCANGALGSGPGGSGGGIGACVALNANCIGTAPGKGTGPAKHLIGGGVGACVALNAACANTAPGKGTGPAMQPVGGGTVGPGAGSGSGGGNTGGLPFGNGTLSADGGAVLASAFAANGCGSNGELIARASNIASGRALTGVRVHVWGPFTTTVSTGADGHATIARLPLGVYQATFSRPGYRSTRPVALTIGCTTAAVIDGHLARAGAHSASTTTLAFAGKLDKASARMAAHASTFCVANGRGTACAKAS